MGRAEIEVLATWKKIRAQSCDAIMQDHILRMKTLDLCSASTSLILLFMIESCVPYIHYTAIPRW